MEFAPIFWWTTLWLLVWGIVGSIGTRRIYLAKDLDTSNAVLMGSLVGASLGPIGLLFLWLKTPEASKRLIILPSLLTVGIIMTAFALADPQNNCVSNSSFVLSQITNGLIIGIIYGLMALGLTLIFSILGVVSFSHGEFYMIGGMITYYVTVVWFPGISPVVGILIACLATFILGAVFERLFLTPMYDGRIERPVEYGILVTFGLAFTLMYFVQAVAGSNPVKAKRFFDFPRIRFPSKEDPWLIKTSRGNMELFDTISISNPRFIAAVISILVLLGLLYFLYKTWTGKAFAMGGMIAALSGATLVQAFSWLPHVGLIPAMRSFVIVVLGGLGSLPGAFFGGIIIGLVEAAGTGCVPDPQKASSYIPAYGMIVLTLTLLLRPTGLMGRRFASGTHGKL